MADKRPPLSSFVKTTDSRPPLSSFVNTPEVVDNRNILQKLGDVAKSIPDYTGTRTIFDTVGSIVATPLISQESKFVSKFTDKVNQKSTELLKQANEEKDPAKKQVILAQIKGLTDQLNAISGKFGENVQQAQQISGMGEKEMAMNPVELAAKRGVGTAAELGSFLIPGPTTATRIGRIGQAGISGTTMGALQGVAEAARTAETGSQAVEQVGKGAVIGGVLGAGLQGVGEIVKGVAGKFSKPVVEKTVKEMDNIDQIINAAENPEEVKKKTAISGFRKIYQSAFPFSKKGNAFEKLKPEQTVDDMIKYRMTGTSDTIRQNVSKLSGDNGVLTNLVDLGIDNVDNPNTIKMPEIDRNGLIAKFSEIGKKEVNQQAFRIADLKPGKLPGETVLRDMVKLERDFTKEGYDAITKGYSAGSLKSVELGELKLGLADQLRTKIDQFVGKSVVTKDPRIVQYLQSVGGPKLAEDYLSANSVSDLRRLQTSFVRMSKIADLSEQLPSSLGNKFFGIIGQLPIAGPIIQSVTKPAEQAISTNIAVQGQRLFDLLGKGSQIPGQAISKVSQTGLNVAPMVINPSVAALQRSIDLQRKAKQSTAKLP